MSVYESGLLTIDFKLIFQTFGWTIICMACIHLTLVYSCFITAGNSVLCEYSSIDMPGVKTWQRDTLAVGGKQNLQYKQLTINKWKYWDCCIMCFDVCMYVYIKEVKLLILLLS